ncbi:MAG: DNRLRE domain-containing protein [Anaerolineae bacterium]|nr:DNRLRE domain-containing protein [Anaerolineae bacterium]
MNHLRRHLLLFGIWVLVISVVGVYLPCEQVSAQATVLIPTDDSCVDTLNPDDNYDEQNGWGLGVWVYSSGVTPVPQFIGFLRFDVSGLSYAEAANVTLRIYEKLGAGTDVTLNVYGADGDDWNGTGAGLGDETTLTYNNAPTAGNLLGSVQGNGSSTWWEYQSVELGTYVQSQLPSEGGNGLATFRIEARGSGQAQAAWIEDRETGVASGYTAQLVAYPTAVTLTSFTTTSLPGAIRLDWQTASETRLLGFDLYRAPSPGSTPELLNDAPLPAQGIAATYDYLDSTARAGNTYYYWIDLVDLGGIPTRYGPQSATAGFFRIYLPVIVR